MSTRACPTCRTLLPDEAAFCSQCGGATATQILGESLTEHGVSRRPSASYELEPLQLARALGPNYELGRLIGRGGYAEVFAVKDRKLKRELAIKVLRPDLVLTQSLLARFRREAEAVAALRHAQIVPVYDVGEAGGICYIVMPLIQGESLKAVLQREGRMPVPELERIIAEAANALGAAHDAGVIHRDIKPENIMLEGPARRVMLMDFGIAKAVDAGDRELTGTGVIVGTPQYMSPEQAAGDPSIDHRTDQYSLAVVAYQMASGRVPFDGETARAVMARQLLEEPPRVSTLVRDLPAPFVAALHRALQKSPALRFEGIRDFAAALAAGAMGPEHRVRAARGRGSPVRRWLPRLAGVAAVAIVGVALSQWRSPAANLAPAGPAPEPVPAPAGVRPAGLDPAPGLASDRPVVPPAPPPSPVPAPGPTAVARADNPPGHVDTAPTPVRSEAAPPADCRTLFDRQAWAQAYRLCLDEARAGSPDAGRYLGVMLSEGRATSELAPVEETRYLGQAARNGHARAQFLMAQRYDIGQGVPRDITRATELYLAAALARVPYAFPIAAYRLEVGLGKPRDLPAAARWYEAGAESGDVPSQVKIASMYAAGTGVARDDAKARRWYQRAAAANNAEAMYRLAQIHFEGRGVPKSSSEGMTWLERAASAGSPEARRELARRGEP